MGELVSVRAGLVLVASGFTFLTAFEVIYRVRLSEVKGCVHVIHYAIKTSSFSVLCESL